MKRWIAFALFLCLVGTQIYAQDYILVETLIKGHKELSDKLKKRIPIESSVLGTHYLLEEQDKKYDALTDTLSQRMGSKITDASLVPEVVRLTMEAQAALRVADKTYSKALEMMLVYPFVYDMIVELNQGMSNRINEIYKLTAMVVTNGLKVSLGTAEQRYVYLNVINNKIQWIRESMVDFYGTMLFMEMNRPVYPSQIKKANADEIYRRTLRQIDKMDSKF